MSIAPALRRLAVIPLVALLPLLAGCSPSAPAAQSDASSSASAPDKVTIALDWLAQPSNAGAFVALDQGYYKDANLDVIIQPGGTSSTSVQVVAGGGAQFGLEYGTQILQARQQGIDIVSLAPTLQKTPAVYLFHKGQDIKTLADLNGRTVYTQPSSAEWEYTVKKYDLTTATAVQFQGSYAAFAADDRSVAQGYVTSASAELAAQGVDVESIPADSAAINYGSSLFTTQKLIDSNPDLVKRFVQATTKGWDYIEKNPKDAAAILVKNAPDSTVDAIEAEFEQQTAFSFEGDAATYQFGWQTKARWDAIADLAVKWGIIPDVSAAEGAWTTEFLPSK